MIRFLAWHQLTAERRRLLTAVAGIAFAVLLQLMQFGFRDALFTSSTSLHNHLRGDFVLVSSQYEYILSTGSFTRRRLNQALGLEEVESVASLYVGNATFKNTENSEDRRIVVLGFDPHDNVFDLPSVQRNLHRVMVMDVVLFDALSRPEFGPVEKQLLGNEVLRTEVAGREVEIGGIFELGASFAGNGHLITSDITYRRIFHYQNEGLVNIGLIRLKPGVQIERFREKLRRVVPIDVKIMTVLEFRQLEQVYWDKNTAVGFIFLLGTFVGLLVGAVIVYQILYTDVSDHLAEYATLKAMGYKDRFFYWVVLQESVILSFIGFPLGFVLSQGLYKVTRDATRLPMYMTFSRVGLVFALTLFMCGLAGVLAMRKLKSADPADVF